MTEYKQVILVRKDLKMSKGKIASQVSHASVDVTLKSDRGRVDSWVKKGMKKVVLKVENEDELLQYKRLADKMKLINSIIKDAGKTEISPGTLTCLAIGPDDEKKINEISGKLKVL